MILSESEFEAYNYSDSPIELPDYDKGAALKAELLKKSLITSDEFNSFNVNKEHWGLGEDRFDQIVRHIWTNVDTDDNRYAYAVPGIHFVNRQSLLVTEKPWTEDIDEAVYADFGEEAEDLDEDEDEDDFEIPVQSTVKPHNKP